MSDGTIHEAKDLLRRALRYRGLRRDMPLARDIREFMGLPQPESPAPDSSGVEALDAEALPCIAEMFRRHGARLDWHDEQLRRIEANLGLGTSAPAKDPEPLLYSVFGNDEKPHYILPRLGEILYNRVGRGNPPKQVLFVEYDTNFISGLIAAEVEGATEVLGHLSEKEVLYVVAEADQGGSNALLTTPRRQGGVFKPVSDEDLASAMRKLGIIAEEPSS